MESGGNHRRRCRAADIGFRADGEEEARCADDFRDDEDEGDVEEHPDHADHDDAEVVENLVQLHLHADRADEDIDENGAEARAARVFQFTRAGEGEKDAENGGEHHQPEEGAVQAVTFRPRELLEPGGDVVAKEMAGADYSEGDAEDDHQIGERRNALILARVFLDGVFQRVDGAGVRFQPAVHAFRLFRHKEQANHPELGDDNVHHDHRAKEGVIDVIQLFHRRLVGAAANPAASDGGKAFPQIARDPFGVDDTEEPNGKRPAEDNADGRGEKHGERLPAETDDFLNINGKGEEEQRRR